MIKHETALKVDKYVLMVHGSAEDNQAPDRSALPPGRPPTAENFRLEEGTIPAISSGQVLLRTRRIRMQGFIVFEDYGQRYGG